MIKKLIISILMCFVAQTVFASVEFHQIEVEKFVEKDNDEFVMIFKPLDTIPSLHKTESAFLHIRFNANCVTELKQSNNLIVEKEKYLAALTELKSQISISKTINFGLKSGKGFYKIIEKTKENHYQCDNLSLLIMGNQKIVYAVHADIADGYCE